MALEVKNPPANAGDIRDVSSIPGQGARFHMLQLRVQKVQLKVPYEETKMEDLSATNKTWHRKIEN